MIYHYSPSHGQQCGIAYFADALTPYLGCARIVSDIKDAVPGDTIILEHEYGLDNKIDWKSLKLHRDNIIVIQHAYSTLDQYTLMNANIMDNAKTIVFLNVKAKLEAMKQFPECASRFVVIPHYCEDMISVSDAPAIPTLGIHGFGFPRNGFISLLDSVYRHIQKTNKISFRLHIMCSINSFNETAKKETSIYIDKIRRKIWNISESLNIKEKDLVTLDIHFYDTKAEIIQELAKNCTATVHMTTPTRNYINASGSVRTLMAAGRPVLALDSIFVEDIKDYCYVSNSIDDIIDAFDNNTYTQTKSISEFCKENTAESFANRIRGLMGETRVGDCYTIN
jgi:hypothetical protein